MTTVLQISDTHIVPQGALVSGRLDTADALERLVTRITRIRDQIGSIEHSRGVHRCGHHPGRGDPSFPNRFTRCYFVVRTDPPGSEVAIPQEFRDEPASTSVVPNGPGVCGWRSIFF